MSLSVLVKDESSPGKTTGEMWLDLPSERLKVRDLVRLRVYREVEKFNSDQSEYYRGLVQPEETEVTLNGFRLGSKRKIDPKKQYLVALSAFAQNGYFILVNDRQAESLDEEILFNENTTISFLRLVPLVGG